MDVPNARARPRHPQLADLPNEVLFAILAHFSTRPPSEVNFHARPSASLTHSASVPLKSLSLTSCQLRALVLPLLFTYARLDPTVSVSFINFLATHKLANHVLSVVAHLEGPATHLHPVWWSTILTSLPALKSLTLLCPPYVLAEIAGISIIDTDSWVFNMPYQILRLSHPADEVSTLLPAHHPTSLLSARRWTRLAINEGSSLKAYSSYEYFLRQTPSLINSLSKLLPRFHTPMVPAPAPLLPRLTSVTYTAIFPFFNHVSSFLIFARHGPAITELAISLCSDPLSKVIEDELADAKGHIDINDAWMEWETSWSLIGRNVSEMEGLQLFETRDVRVEGVREDLIEGLEEALGSEWMRSGEGRWVKRKKEKEEADGRPNSKSSVS